VGADGGVSGRGGGARGKQRSGGRMCRSESKRSRGWESLGEHDFYKVD